MKPIKNTKSYLRNILLPLFTFMLVLSTVLPSVALAAEGGLIEVELDTNPTIITEAKINNDGFKVTLTLSDLNRKWVSDVDSQDKKTLLIDSMTVDNNPAAWNKYKDDLKQKLADVTVVVDDQKLTLTLPASSVYEISQDETITMNLSPALIENWPGQVTPVTIDIYADPQISMGGSVMSSVTAEEIRKGGKEIELKLVNATWNETEFYEMAKLKTFLDQFGNTPIDIAKYVNLANPNDVIEFPNPQTLKIKLPAIPYIGTGGVVTFNPVPLLPPNGNYATIDKAKDGTTSLGDDINEISPMSFDIKPSTASSLEITTNPNPITEENVIAGNQATITLKLSGSAKWDSNLTNAKKNALIDALEAENQADQWKKVKDALTSANVKRVDETEITIEIPKVEGYYLTANQKISLQAPHQLLVDDVDLNSVEFEIKAKPKALISGTVTPEVSQADIIKGGETIIVTLVNAKWDADIAKQTALREKLLNGFTFDTAYKAVINAGASVVRTNDQVVTITLPPIVGFKIGSDTPIAFNENSITANETLVSTTPKAFTITPVANQTATISGSITNSNEFDIVKGGKTITITLKNDVWAKDLSTKPITFSDTKLTYTNIKRVSDTVAELTLNGISDYSLTEDTSVTLDIPAELLSISSGKITTSAFKIAAVTAELPKKENLVLDKSDIQKGGKTITITLKNATFKENLTTNEITTIFTGTASGKNMIVNAINNDPKAIKITKDKITIKLPPIPGYNSTNPETIRLQIPRGLINHDSPRDIPVDGEIAIGAVATATLNGSSFTNQQIKAGNATITITLTGGIEWDPTIETNKSKKSALLKGFTVSDQTKEWSLLSKEISANAQFELNNAKNALKITFPAVPDYSIIRNQVVDIKIPKSVLASYKDDIEVANKLTITVPRGAISDKTLGDLTAEELAKAIEDNKRVIVPAKVVETIFVNTVELPEKQSITTIEITTTSAVEQVQVTVAGGTAQTVEPKGNKSVFVYTNLEKNSELKVSVFGSDKSKPLQSDIYKKIGKGNKTYSEIPKKDLTGSYSIYTLLTDKSLLKDIFKHYSIDELKVTQ
ncbi:hypothetical protein ACFPRA_09345 [Sporosarcina soli]|uniref:Uncharacterized protein n=1 Tax=Sporosarcina soli TaxID=334736 RepID=A0ABW0TI75_9BACL